MNLIIYWKIANSYSQILYIFAIQAISPKILPIMKTTLRYHQLHLILLIFLFSALTKSSISGQSCYPNGVTFTSQAQIDQFPSLNPGCSIIGSHLIIQGYDITNLDSLYSIEEIDGYFRLNSSSLTSFKGLNNLGTIRATFIVTQSNTSLSSFEGLESLKMIGTTNNQIHSFENMPIVDFTGLESLNSVSGILNINNCNDLVSLAGLESLTELYQLTVENCYSFSSLQGFGNVSNLPTLRLRNLQFLENLSGLEGVDTIQNSIWIENNNSLDDISVLDSTDFSTLFALNINNNPNLSTCDLKSICEYINIDGNISINNNNVGCNYLSELVVACCANDTIWCPEEMESCHSDGLTLISQLQVDLFPAVNPGCKIINGDVSINSNDITNLDSLYPIEHIQGNLNLIQSSLTNFEGLNNLDTIGEEFNINNNSPNLINFEGLGSLKKIGFTMFDSHTIRSESIEDFAGLDSLHTILGTLDIMACSNLASLNGLGAVAEMDELSIANCSSFSSLQGFGNDADLSILKLSYLPLLANLEGMESVENVSQLTLSNLDFLASLENLTHLTSIDQLFIFNCDILKTLNGLEGLLDVQVFVRLFKNDELSDITALQNVDFSNTNSLTFTQNPKLSFCAINSICDFIEIGGITDFENNEIGCNSEVEIEYDCDDNLSIFQGSGSNLPGTPNSFWHNPNNWKNNLVPNENSYVIIPKNYNCNVQSDSIANCKILEARSGTTLSAGINSVLNVLEE